MRFIVPCVLTTLFALAATGFAQDPPAQPTKPQTVPAAQVRELPIAPLPADLADPSFGLDLKLPGGFVLAPSIDALRKEARTQFEQQELPAGVNTKPRTQLWAYQSDSGAAIVVLVNEVLLTPLASPTAMANKMNNQRASTGVTVNPIGEPKFFKARDAHVGFLIEREVSLARGGPILKHELIGYVRAGGRDVTVSVSAPLGDFDARKDEYLALFATIQLAEIETAPMAVKAGDMTVPKTSPGFNDWFTIGVLLVCVGAIVLLVRMLRTPPATATTL